MPSLVPLQPIRVPVPQDLADRLLEIQGYCLENHVGASGGTIIRTLIENVPEKSKEFAAQVAVRGKQEYREKQSKRSRPTHSVEEASAQELAISINLPTSAIRKLELLQGYCLSQRVRAYARRIIRTLIAHAPTKSPEMLAQIAAQVEAEAEEKAQKFQKALAANRRAARPKKH